MKNIFSIGDTAFHSPTGKYVHVVGTKLEPYKPSVDVFNRKEIIPENDYWVFCHKPNQIDAHKYEGTMDVLEEDLEKTSS